MEGILRLFHGINYKGSPFQSGRVLERRTVKSTCEGMSAWAINNLEVSEAGSACTLATNSILRHVRLRLLDLHQQPYGMLVVDIRLTTLAYRCAAEQNEPARLVSGAAFLGLL